MCCTRECLTRRLQNAISSTMVILVFTTKLWSRLLATEKAGHRIAIRRSEYGSLLRLHQLSRIFVMVVKTVVDRCTNTARQTQLVDKLMNVAARTFVSIYVDKACVERHVRTMRILSHTLLAAVAWLAATLTHSVLATLTGRAICR